MFVRAIDRTIKPKELALSAPPPPKREVNDDVCSVLDRARRDHLGRRVHASTAGKQFDMFVYAASSGVRDIVSESISSNGSWERGDTEKLMSLLPHDEALHGEKIDGSARKKGVFLDVGANVGWFSMVALNLGHDVIAFEPFESNVELMCASLGDTMSSLGENFHLHQLGLDFKPRRCELFQQRHVNIGDTHSVCDDKTRAHFLGNGYASLGWMNTTTLDDALLTGLFDHVERVDVMKIDVEGFEPSVIFGGNRFFQSEYAPTYVFMEMVSSFMDSAFGSRRQGDDYIRAVLMHLVNHGYELDSYSTRGDEASSLRTNTFDEIRHLIERTCFSFVELTHSP